MFLGLFIILILVNKDLHGKTRQNMVSPEILFQVSKILQITKLHFINYTCFTIMLY